jgi:serine phosphatase RsbU (regulator of sigma subunit)
MEVILAQLAAFRGNAPQTDDMTVLVVGSDESSTD